MLMPVFLLMVMGLSAASQKPLAVEDAWKLSLAIEQIREFSMYAPSDEQLVSSAIRGMLSGLDPQAEYLDASSLASLNATHSGAFVGIGVELDPKPEGLLVMACFEDTPAFRSGIRAGDRILKIQNIPVGLSNYTQALALLRGRVNSTVDLWVQKPNAETSMHHVRRELLSHFSVQFMPKDHLIYIRIPWFTERTDFEIEQALEKTDLASFGGVIVDLRGNPGGLVDSAIRVADLFLDADKIKKKSVIVSSRARSKMARFTAYASAGDVFLGLPVVIWVDAKTASAAEIFVSALKDHDRAFVMGQRTFGKGSVQSVLMLTQDEGIKLTTAFYQSPKGREIQGIGVEPHEFFESSDFSKWMEASQTFFDRQRS